MRSFLLILLLTSPAMAQDSWTGVTIGAQTGYEVILYSEDFFNGKGNPATLEGSSSAIVGTISIEYDLERSFNVPLFAAVSVATPINIFTGTEHGTFRREGITYINQRQDVEHLYQAFRAFAGYKLKSVFTPFVIFERSLFQSTRSNMVVGTDSGVLVPADSNITWHERVWSSHIGAGFQGGIPLDGPGLWSLRYRMAAMMPTTVFVTNDHPAVFTQNGELGVGSTGLTILARLAMHYQWHPRSSVQLSMGLYSREWDGDGALIKGARWPANDMDAFPVLLGVTWAI